MNDRPWFAHYDKGVPQTIDYPKAPLFHFLEESTRKYPDRACTMFKGAVITYKEMNAITDHIAAALALVSTVAMTIRGFYLQFPAYFRTRGYRIDAMARGISTCDQCKQAFDNVWDVSWTRNPFDIIAVIRSAKQIRAIVAKEQHDIVHVCTPIAAFVTRVSLRHLRAEGKVKVVYTAHGFHFYKGGPFIRNAVFLFWGLCLRKRRRGWYYYQWR